LLAGNGHTFGQQGITRDQSGWKGESIFNALKRGRIFFVIAGSFQVNITSNVYFENIQHKTPDSRSELNDLLRGRKVLKKTVR
jgi:hypothetical protein